MNEKGDAMVDQGPRRREASQEMPKICNGQAKSGDDKQTPTHDVQIPTIFRTRPRVLLSW